MKYPTLKPGLLLPLWLLAMLPVSQIFGLSGDREQPIHIDADRMVAEEARGYSHYLGNVHITQGSLKIDADEVYIYLVDGALNKLIIIGNPAKLQQIPDNSTEVVYSRAKRMEYFTSTDRLLLMEDAEVWQGANRFAGEHIEYDTRNSRVSANSVGKESGRIRAVIVPKKAATSATPADETATSATPADETAASTTPADETATSAIPADETATSAIPADETATSATPADETPTDKAP